jgi:hypothetical protein
VANQEDFERTMSNGQQGLLFLSPILSMVLLLPLWLPVFRLKDEKFFESLVKEHALALVGLPAAVALSFLVVLIYDRTVGHIELSIGPLKFKGAAGPIILWIASFLAIVGSLRLLWT